MTNKPSIPETGTELEDLRARLAETEEVLRAIRSGEVDAVVVTGERGEQVYTLSGADRVYRQLIEAMSEGAATLSGDGTILYCNARLAEMLGRPLDQVLGTALRGHLPPADREALDAVLAQARKEPTRREISLETGGGRLAPVYLSASLLQGEGAETVFCLVFTDLTEQRSREKIAAAAEALRESEARYRLLFNGSRDAFMTVDPVSGTFTGCNPVVLKMFKVKDEAAFIAAKPWELSPELQPDGRRSAEKARELQSAAMKDGAAFFEWTHRLPDGTEFPAEVLLTRIDKEAGPLIFAMVRDITKRKRAEAALIESETKYRTLHETSRDALMTLFPPDWKFTSGNPATVAIFGAKDEADFISRGPWEVSPEYQPDGELSSVKAKRMIETAMEKGSNFFEWTHKKIGGPDFPATVLLTRIELNGKTGLQATVRDISAQKQAEAEREKLREQLLQSQKMEAVGQLAGGVAHDFNNILTAIQAYAEFIRKALPPEDPMRSDAQEILSAANRAAALTRQLLAYSRRQIMAPKVTDLNKAIGDMTKMLRRIIGEDIQLSVKLFPAACLANVDIGQMEQVIMNLAVNARDAAPKGGEIKLETEILLPPDEFFSARPDLARGKLVCVRVRDNGCGMSAEVKSRLFEPFFTTKGTGKGTGLGLSTAFGIVKQSGGEITVESEPGKGTTFCVYLPLTEACLQDKDKDKEPPVKGHETVLFVEDEETLRRLGERILRAGGYTVLIAASGQAALKLMEERGRPVDLLITDLVMPGMSGRELAVELERRKLVGRVLYTSGYTDDAIVKHGVLEPGIAFIYKPYTVEALSVKLREVLAGPADQAKA